MASKETFEAPCAEDSRRGIRTLVVLVVGNGMVSHRFCEKMVEYDRQRRHRIVVVGEESRPAYDRVHLTNYFADRSADPLCIGPQGWYAERGIELRLGVRVTRIDAARREARTDAGATLPYDVLVLATGSAPFVPPVPGADKAGVFVYRTIDDLEAILAHAAHARRAAVIGGGLLGLEAARAVLDLGLETHVVEVAPRLMPRQLDPVGAGLLERAVRDLGVHVHTDKRMTALRGGDVVEGIDFADGTRVDADLVIFSAGIRPRDELARDAEIAVGPRGGVVVDDRLRTSDERVFAIGEVAVHDGTVYGLVAPGYAMADVLAQNLSGGDAAFAGSDLSARLKLLGTDVATFGDPFCDPDRTRVVCLEDQVRRTYKKFILDDEGRRLLGGMLVGDASSYGAMLELTRSHTVLSETLDELGIGATAVQPGVSSDDARVCSCNGVSAGTIRLRIREQKLASIADVKSCTRAGTGCGGCLPVVTDLLRAELEAAGRAGRPRLCEHFAFTRQELFQIVAATGIRTFPELIAQHGEGTGCEICKPTAASILASIHNEPILGEGHRTLQDSNDRYLANIQKNGTYSVVPRVPGGEITADQLVALGQVAKRHGLYAKVTGGQRIDLLGARMEALPAIWSELVAAGFESGHAYGKAMRTVKSCVGSTWCRYGVQDSTAFAIRIEHRYKGIRAPHKLKSAVSGCVRECAEARGKDFGLIATDKGWNIYVCGNGGVSPRHAELLAADVDEDSAIRYLDRFVMFYIRTADRLTRTSVWLDKMEGGIEHLRRVVVDDSLGIGADLERAMQALVDTYQCEWTEVVRDPEKQAWFREFAPKPPTRPQRRLPVLEGRWVRVASARDVPDDGGIAVRHGDREVAIFHFSRPVAGGRTWYATDNVCPHKVQSVLSRGLLGDQAGTPKVACPLHKKTFDLATGACLSGDPLAIRTFAVRVEGDDVWIELPHADELRPVPAPATCAAATSPTTM